LSQLISEGHVHSVRRAVCLDDSTNRKRLGQHGVLGPMHKFGQEERLNVLPTNHRTAAACTDDRRRATGRLGFLASGSARRALLRGL
jgi:hypothetical protein